MMGEAYIVRSADAWRRQAREAHERLLAAPGVTPGMTLADLADVDREQFGLLIEAFVALGQPVSDDLIRLARLRPVTEVLGLP